MNYSLICLNATSAALIANRPFNYWPIEQNGMQVIRSVCSCLYVEHEYYFICAPIKTCDVHGKLIYPCDYKDCGCTDYRPRRMPWLKADGSIAWPTCVCGHIAQEHN